MSVPPKESGELTTVAFEVFWVVRVGEDMGKMPKVRLLC